MARYARIADGRVAEIMIVPDGLALEALFHPDIAAALVACGDDVFEGFVHADGAFAPPSAPPPSRADLIAHVKALRYARETAGVTVAIAGEDVRVSTARGDDRAALHQTFSAIGASLRADGATFNFADGKPRAVGNADMRTAVLSALAHVQAAFDLEAAVTAQIEAGAVTTREQIDAAFA